MASQYGEAADKAEATKQSLWSGVADWLEGVQKKKDEVEWSEQEKMARFFAAYAAKQEEDKLIPGAKGLVRARYKRSEESMRRTDVTELASRPQEATESAETSQVEQIRHPKRFCKEVIKEPGSNVQQVCINLHIQNPIGVQAPAVKARKRRRTKQEMADAAVKAELDASKQNNVNDRMSVRAVRDLLVERRQKEVLQTMRKHGGYKRQPEPVDSKVQNKKQDVKDTISTDPGPDLHSVNANKADEFHSCDEGYQSAVEEGKAIALCKDTEPHDREEEYIQLLKQKSLSGAISWSGLILHAEEDTTDAPDFTSS